MRYIAFDVETPNWANDRMSAIGISVIENGCIIDEFATLINPETHFDRFNIELTGITPAMTADAPTFDELWPEIRPIFDSGLLLAHNAPFDLSVLAKCLRAYQIDWHHRIDYACTCAMARRCCPALPNHKLNTLCRYFGIPLEHHQAGSDSRACAQLFIDMHAEQLALQSCLRRYHLLEMRTEKGRPRA